MENAGIKKLAIFMTAYAMVEITTIRWENMNVGCKISYT